MKKLRHREVRMFTQCHTVNKMGQLDFVSSSPPSTSLVSPRSHMIPEKLTEPLEFPGAQLNNYPSGGWGTGHEWDLQVTVRSVQISVLISIHPAFADVISFFFLLCLLLEQRFHPHVPGKLSVIFHVSGYCKALLWKPAELICPSINGAHLLMQFSYQLAITY